MLADDFVDITIANLKVIGMVPQNGRLCVRKGQLCIDAPDRMQAVRRWMRGDSRDAVLLHVRNTIGNAVRIVTQISPSDTPPLARWTVERIVGEMQQCEAGLRNLRTTYSSDSLTVANINVLIERLAAHQAVLAAGADIASAAAPKPAIPIPIPAPSAASAPPAPPQMLPGCRMLQKQQHQQQHGGASNNA